MSKLNQDRINTLLDASLDSVDRLVDWINDTDWTTLDEGFLSNLEGEAGKLWSLLNKTKVEIEKYMENDDD